LILLPSIPSHPTSLLSPREQEVYYYSLAYYHTLLVYSPLENKKLILLPSIPSHPTGLLSPREQEVDITPQHTITPYWFTSPREQEVDYYSPAYYHTLLVYTPLENKKLILLPSIPSHPTGLYSPREQEVNITPQHTITPY